MTFAADLYRRLEYALHPAALAALQACEAACAERGVPLYLVGGAVRDLLLERDHVDLDLAIDGEVAPVAEALARSLGGRAVFHSRFGTATVSGDGFHLDLARTRRETYTRPGALPTVAPATLLDDLARRDFTINAIALRLTQPHEIVDPFRGENDARSGLVRVLHEGSFRDDATRMLRAARYAARLGFKVERRTESFLKRDLAYADTISGARMRRELQLLFEEATAVEGTQLAQRLGVLAAVHSSLKLHADVARRWRDALGQTRQAPLDELGFGAVATLEDAAVESLAQRLHLAGRVEQTLRDLVRLQPPWSKLAKARNDPGSVVDMLDAMTPAAVWALAVREGGPVADVCNAYLTQWRRVKPHLRGDDLIALGVTPGAAVGEALRALRRARLQDKARSRDDEVAIVRTIVEKQT